MKRYSCTVFRIILKDNIKQIATDAIEQLGNHSELCCFEMKKFLIAFFVKCRLFQSIKFINGKLLHKTEAEKIKKILHQYYAVKIFV